MAPRRSEQLRSRRTKSARYAVGFIGGGNMATALIKGLVGAGLYRARQLCASDVDPRKRQALKRRLGVAVSADNASVVRETRVVVLAVKPQIMDAVLAEIRPAITPAHLCISIAAGIPTSRLEAALGPRARVVRVMPNTPALLGRGMAVVARGRHATGADERLALKLLRAVGKARAVSDERWLDAVTGLSGSGPAFVYLFAEGLIAGGVTAGLSPELAEELALQTLTGAAAMLQETGETPQRLREMVTSPGGTTLAGLGELERRGFLDAVAEAVLVAARRSIELGRG
ncbi:MAG: pyrroline-5-carboxylate reductase [Acidobacteria bacterium RBG_16_68_9]|nr:MAG: pyrroline-5-carboxylate reductase [Acidobacteria bacterium RBG_16_68_9]